MSLSRTNDEARLGPCLDGRFAEVISSYVIASTVRTGSYLLCEGLYATGVAGNPAEAFCRENRAAYRRQWNLPLEVDFPSYFREVVKNGTTANGVFGVKIHWHHIEDLTKECSPADSAHALPHFFPKAKYIYLRRGDVRAQAISYFRAELTNEWWRINRVPNPLTRDTRPVFDAARILQLEEKLRSQDEAWRDFFVSNQIQPLAMEYETLWQDYRNEIARVLEFLGQDSALARDLPEPRLVRQADEMTKEWRKQLDECFPDSH